MEMSEKTIRDGDYVLLGPLSNYWVGCMMLVESTRSWGCNGIVYGPHGHEYPMRARWNEIVAIYRKVGSTN